jgi:peptidoglycan/LPS O-acetylase OafA/YrhL
MMYCRLLNPRIFPILLVELCFFCLFFSAIRSPNEEPTLWVTLFRLGIRLDIISEEPKEMALMV